MIRRGDWAFLSDYGIQRTNNFWATHFGRLLDERGDVIEAFFLFCSGAPQIAAWAHTGANGADGYACLCCRHFECSGVDVLGGFHWNLDGIEAPRFKFFEQLDAFRFEGGDEEERVNSETHGSE